MATPLVPVGMPNHTPPATEPKVASVRIAVVPYRLLRINTGPKL